MADPIAFAARADPDTMYLHEAMKQSDKKEFIKAMMEEVTSHTNTGQWKVIPIGEVPSVLAVWAMQSKRIISCEVYKWKARFNVHGRKAVIQGRLLETYAVAIKWSLIRFFLTHALINGWPTRQLDLVLA